MANYGGSNSEANNPILLPSPTEDDIIELKEANEERAKRLPVMFAREDPASFQKLVRGSLFRAALAWAYCDFEPVQNLTRNCKDLQAINIRSHAEIVEFAIDNPAGLPRAHLVFDTTIFRYHFATDTSAKGSGLYPIRGAGPPWVENSCALDSILVAAQQLGIGSIFVDFASQYRDGWTPPRGHMDLLQGLKYDWMIREISDGKKINQAWRTQLLKSYNQVSKSAYKSGELIPVVPLWNWCAASFPQFQFAYLRHKRVLHCGCGANDYSKEETVLANSITPPHNKNDQTMSQVLERWFFVPQRRKCVGRTCDVTNPLLRNVFTSEDHLPVRLVVQLHQQSRPTGHTSNEIDVKWWLKEGEELVLMKATYRWLGGIYCQGKGSPHFHVVWNDDERGVDLGRIRLYDGMQLNGLIVGNIYPDSGNIGERVPPSRMDADQPSPLLFYELVRNPSRIITSAFSNSYTAIQKVVTDGEKATGDYMEQMKPAMAQVVKDARLKIRKDSAARIQQRRDEGRITEEQFQGYWSPIEDAESRSGKKRKLDEIEKQISPITAFDQQPHRASPTAADILGLP